MTDPIRVAAIDCGTNSIRLLIAESATGSARPGPFVELDRQTEIVRLGQGVDATGEFHPDALARTFVATEGYADRIRAAGVTPDRTHFVATSAARDARNRQAFFDGIEARVGVVPDVITGDAEAQLSFAGALSRVRPAGEPVLVMDIGGGSTEFIVGSAAGELTSAVSLDIGSVRLTERFLRTHPPAAADLSAASAYVDGLLDGTGVDFAAIGTWIGVAGTATTLSGVHLGLAAYDRARVHGSAIPCSALVAMLTELSAMTLAQIRALPSMHPNRADVITGGALVAARVAARMSVAQLMVSESDILDGIALDLIASSTR